MSHATRLSRDADALLAAQARQAGAAFDCELLIVGSGYGGAVAAARLAGSAGLEDGIWMVERGSEYRPGEFPARFAELPGFVRISVADSVRGRRRGGLLDLRLDGDVAVLLGNGLGGGSLINANVMLEPEAEVFAQGWPAGVDASSMRGPYALAHGMLAPAPLPQQLRLRKLELLDRLGQAPAARCPVSVAWQRAPHPISKVELHACTLCGDCMTGCNQGAKGSLDTNYLALAAARGVQMFCGVAVLRLQGLDGDPAKGWEVHWQHSEADAAPPAPIRARRVLLAAGALGSTEILLRSRTRQLPFSQQLGRQFSMNGDAIAAGLGHADPTGTVADPETDPAGTERHIGPTITGYRRVAPSQGRPGFVVQEFAVPAALRRVFGEIVTSLGLLRGARMAGDDTALCSEAHIERMSLYGLMGQDDAAGWLELPPAGATQEGLLRVRWTDVMKLPVFAAMNDWLEQALPPRRTGNADPQLLRLLGQSIGSARLFGRLLWRAGGKWFDGLGRPQPKPDLGDRFVEAGLGLPEARLLDGADLLPLIDRAAGLAVTVHPLGGCRMADGVANGVVNDAGQVWNPSGTEPYPGLAVLDGAILPRALGINPALTITALAERAVPLLKKAWGLGEAAATPAEPAPPPRPPGPRRELPPAESIWRLRERLQGPLRWNGHIYWAVMELEFEDIPGFVRALQLPERALQLRTGTLVLHAWEPGEAHDDFYEPDLENSDQRSSARVQLSARLSGSLRLLMPLLADQLAGLAPPRLSLDYRLAVQACWCKPDLGTQAVLRVGSRLLGRKQIGLPPGIDYDQHPGWLRQLTELDMQIDGVDVGRWSLDQGNLAIMRRSLLSLQRHSSLPDAWLDALCGLAYVTRQLLVPQLLPALAHALEPPQAAHLNQRWPGDQSDVPVELFEMPDCLGARLSRYRAKPEEPALVPPVLLIHGMGASGSSYTHACLRGTHGHLLQVLRDAGREVWVLDVRSSIANETGRREPAAAEWTAEAIACDDIPRAIDAVLSHSGAAQLDLFGHCQGAVMVWMALLSDASLGPKVHAAVFSQVGPWLQMSDSNRLRAFVIGGLLRYLSADELDSCPDFFWTDRDAQGLPVWQRCEPRPPGLLLLDTLLAGGLAYQDHGQEALRADAMGSRHWISLRHRADAIFGQLFELGNLSDATLEHLDALLGWVKLPMLAQAIHFARLRMITDGDGNNPWLNADNLRRCLPFPLLILHGRRNKVFDWQGSWRSLRQLSKLVYDLDLGPPEQRDGWQHYGRGGRAQLMVFENYGHFDCVIGEHAGRDIFPHVVRFLDEAVAAMTQQLGPPTVRITTPFIGPALGWLRWAADVHRHTWLGLRLLLLPKSREARPAALALVPLSWGGGRPEPQWAEAVYALWPTEGDRNRPQHLDLWWGRPAPQAASFALLLLDRPPEPAGPPCRDWRLRWRSSATSQDHGPDAAAALFGLHKAWNDPLWVDVQTREAITHLLRDPGKVQDCGIQLGPQQLAAAQPAALALALPSLCFALASCQYPPSLPDGKPAAAGFELLLKSARRSDGPQFLLLAGDQVYLDADAGTFARPGGMPRPMQERARSDLYESTWRLPARRRCMTMLPCYPMLDDHEVTDNWGGLNHSQRPATPKIQADLAAYEAYQQGLAPATRLSTSGSYAYRINPGGVPFFMLDGRSRRAPRNDPAQAARAEMIPPADMTELEKALSQLQTEHPLLPKFILTAAPLLPLTRDWLDGSAARMLADGWSGYPASARRLLGFIARRNIRRVVLLGGDSHLSSVARLQFKSASGAANEVVAITSSGLYTPWPFANQRPEELLPDGAAVDLGLPCIYRQEIQSTGAGFAMVSLQPPTAQDNRTRLHISLQNPDMLSVFCLLTLD